LDLDAILDFVLNPDSKRKCDTEIVETYDADGDGELGLTSRERRELKSDDHELETNIRYNLFSTLLNSFQEVMFNEDDGLYNIETLHETLAWNTCLQYGFVKQITA
jgi:hypothetical protein